jgi:hypothetical protein
MHMKRETLIAVAVILGVTILAAVLTWLLLRLAGELLTHPARKTAELIYE